MLHFLRKRLLLIILVVVIVGAIVLAFMPGPISVDLAKVTRGPLQVTVDEDGKTRVKERYFIYAPLGGQLRRIEWFAGDVVEESTALAYIESRYPDILDERALDETKALVKKREEELALVKTNREHAAADFDRAQDLKRRGGAITPEDYDKAEYRERTSRNQVRIAEFALEEARAAEKQIRPRSPGDPERWRFPIRSPIKGVVLDVPQKSEKVVTAGETLLELGDLSQLECEIDVLSPDAVKIDLGGKVLLKHWGGTQVLNGKVLRKEKGFTKFSALGVEEQRVNVIVDFSDPREKWQRLGDGYRVEASFIIWEKPSVLKIPSGARFRHGDGWAVFAVVGGIAELRPVKIGESSGIDTEILDGLAEGDQVILHPSDKIKPGVSVVPR